MLVDNNGNLVNERGYLSTQNYYIYPENSLYKTVTKSENWDPTIALLNTTEEYKDKQGNVILKRTYVEDSTTIKSVETYYVYDDFGLLRYVIPPKAAEQMRSVPDFEYSLADDLIKNLCYYYKYDERKRMIIKKLPGAGEIWMVYDIRDRLVAVQDGRRREENNLSWLFTKYDILNRPILTVEYIHNTSGRETLQTFVNNFNTESELCENMTTDIVHGYTNNSFPNVSSEDKFLTVTYYDEYDFSDKIPYSGSDSYEQNIIGLVTGGYISISNSSTST